MSRLLLLPACAAIAFAQAPPGVSAARFGAHPDDGATDATAGIQSAIDANRGGRVYLPADVPGSGAAVTATVLNGSISGFEIVATGSGYCKPPAIVIPGAKATAHIDGNCRLTSVTVDDPGSGLTAAPAVTIVPQLRCYKVRQIRVLTGMVLEGDGEGTCIVPDGSGTTPIFSDGAYAFRLRDLSLKGDGSTEVGMQFNGATQPGPGSDALLCTLDGVSVSGFRSKNIELNRSYGFVFLNVRSYASAGWGLYLRDGYNNATQVIGGEYSANAAGGVYIGTDSIQFHFSSIAEGNGKYGIYYHGHASGIQIDDAYFEANGGDGSGWDVYGDFLDYDQPAYGVSIRNSLFNSPHAAGAASIQNTVDFEFSHNWGVPPLQGDPPTASVVLGRGVVNLVAEGNTGTILVNGAATPVHTGPANFAENLFLYSNAMNRAPWHFENSGPGCPGRAFVCQDGVRFQDNGPAWKIALAMGSGAANTTTIGQKMPVAAGHLTAGGVWIRTDKGTATAWVELFDGDAFYTGSRLNQPLRQTIDTNWRWVVANAATDVKSKGATEVRVRLYANDRSEARAVYLYAPQAWEDAATLPQYVATAGRPVRRQMVPVQPRSRAIAGPPNCAGAADGTIGYDTAADKLWVCSGGKPKFH